MKQQRLLGPLLIALVLSGCAATYTLVKPGRVVVADLYTVKPNIEWSSLKEDNAQTWTIDGFALQSLHFIQVKEGRAIFETPEKKHEALFRANMTETEIAEMIADELSLLGAKAVELKSLRPQPFGSIDGFGMDMEYLTNDGLEARALILGTVSDAKLYLIMYTGARLHYFDRYVDEAKAIMDSIQIKGGA